MSDLISRQTAIDTALTFLVEYCGATFDEDMQKMLCERLDALPSAEPERKKGEWIKVGHWGRSYKCNQCGNYLDFDGVNAGRGDANFCPNCGADMRGEHE